MNKDIDQSNALTAEKEPAASSRLPPLRPRHRQRQNDDRHKAGRPDSHNGGSPREGLALARHRNGVHRRLEQIVVCEIPDPLPIGVRELEVFAALLGDGLKEALAAPE